MLVHVLIDFQFKDELKWTKTHGDRAVGVLVPVGTRCHQMVLPRDEALGTADPDPYFVRASQG